MPEIHPTVPVLVWADVDAGIAEMVAELNKIDGVRTDGSCQGTIGEGGAEPYPPFVMVHWHHDAARDAIRQRYCLVIEGESWGYVYPSGQEGPPNG